MGVFKPITLALSIAWVLVACSGQSTETVITATGPVRGEVVDEVAFFLGIPLRRAASWRTALATSAAANAMDRPSRNHGNRAVLLANYGFWKLHVFGNADGWLRHVQFRQMGR